MMDYVQVLKVFGQVCSCRVLMDSYSLLSDTLVYTTSSMADQKCCFIMRMSFNHIVGFEDTRL